MEQLPINLSLATLQYHCSHEMSNYYQKKQSDDRFCLEIFRRAVVDRSNEAWIALQESFGENVLYWLRTHPKKWEALQLESEQNYVDDTFKRLWVWGNNNQHLEFHTLAGALKFLRLCLESLIVDTLRSSTRRERISLPEDKMRTVLSGEDAYDNKELWQVIQSLLSDKRERRVIYLLYHEGLKPRDIMKHCPGEFADEKEVYRLTRNALDRLRRNADIIRWKISYEE